MQSPASSPAPSRLWRVLPVAVTLALAAAFVVGSATGLLSTLHPVGTWLIPATLALQAAVLGLRYRWPLAVFLSTIVLDIPYLIVSSGEMTVGSFAIMVAVYTLRRTHPAARAYPWALGGLLVTGVSHYVTLGGSQEIGAEWRLLAALGQAVSTYAVALMIAEVVIAQARLATILRERAELAERDQERNAREAIQQERKLIARELHDIAAHHLTGIIVSNQAARALMMSDPERARSYLDTVQTEARTALDNVRQTVGLLRTGDETDLAPAPGLADLQPLIDGYRARGIIVTYETIGEPVPLGPIAGIVLYRTVQESLANASKHAPGSRCAVRAEWSSAGVRITIENSPATLPSPPVPPGGNGLIGMRERAALVQGTLAVGPQVSGGWAVELTVPAPDQPAAELFRHIDLPHHPDLPDPTTESSS